MSSASPLARWLNWKPPILAEVLDHEPPKPTEAAFEGFAGDPSGQSLKIEAASAVFNRRGVRIMRIDGGAVIGIWSDLDGPEIREALQVVEVTLPIRYLDGAGIPPPYRTRRVAGEAVPLGVLAAMEQHMAEPWKVRDSDAERNRPGRYFTTSAAKPRKGDVCT